MFLKEKILKYANGIYNQYRYDIMCEIRREEFYRAKFILDQINAEKLCFLIYNKITNG